MYKNGEDTISIAEATSSADLLGLSVENWANEYGWSLEGKTTVPGGNDSTDGTSKRNGRWGFQFGRYFIGVTRS